MILVIEAVILCVLFSVMVYIMSQEPIKTLYNYPPKIQERVKSMEMYKDHPRFVFEGTEDMVVGLVIQFVL